MSRFILAIDQGTTSSRAVLFSPDGAIVDSAQEEFDQHFPRDGWVEHKPEDLWNTVLTTARLVLEKTGTSAEQIAAIGITNQRETALVWDRHTGEPVYPAIVWQDRRTSKFCTELREQGYEPDINARTGLLIDPYFSATKLCWILNEVEGARARAERGDLLFGTVDSYLLWKLTGGRMHRTDATNACRTLLFNIHTQEWDPVLLDLFKVPPAMLPEVMDSAADFGETEPDLFGKPIPVLGIAGDQQAALFGQTCFKPGMAKSTYGTGCFLVLNTGDQVLKSNNRLLATVAYRLNGKPTYALEGSIFVAGATIQWLRDGLQLIRQAGETESLARQTPLDHGVFMVPAFTGLGAPYWDPDARGAIFGLTRDTGIKEIVTAGLQSVCFQTKDLQKAMERDGVRPTTLRVDGGMVANSWVLQFLANILGCTVDRPRIIETTALGAAYLAGLQAGVFESLDALQDLWQCDRRFEPEMTKAERDGFYDGWKNAVRRVQSDGH